MTEAFRTSCGEALWEDQIVPGWAAGLTAALAVGLQCWELGSLGPAGNFPAAAAAAAALSRHSLHVQTVWN